VEIIISRRQKVVGSVAKEEKALPITRVSRGASQSVHFSGDLYLLAKNYICLKLFIYVIYRHVCFRVQITHFWSWQELIRRM